MDDYVLIKIKKDFSEVSIMNTVCTKEHIQLKEINKIYRKLGLSTDEKDYDKNNFYRYDYRKKSSLDTNTHAKIGD